MTSLNGQTRLALSTNQDWRNYPLSAPPNTTTTPLSFHINMECFEWKSLKKVMVRACFFQKNNDPPAPGHLGGSKPPCFSPTVFDAGRVAIRIPMPLRLAVPAEPQAAKRLKTDQKSVPLARFVVFSCWVFGSKWKKYNTWKFSSAIIRQISRMSKKNVFDCGVSGLLKVYGLPQSFGKSFPVWLCAYFLQEIEVVTTN